MKIGRELEGKRVKIVDIDGTIFEGTVCDYIAPEDNDPEGVAAVNIENCPQRPEWAFIGFNETEIRSLTVLS